MILKFTRCQSELVEDPRYEIIEIDYPSTGSG